MKHINRLFWIITLVSGVVALSLIAAVGLSLTYGTSIVLVVVSIGMTLLLVILVMMWLLLLVAMFME